MNRRSFASLALGTAALHMVEPWAWALAPAQTAPDLRLSIQACKLEIGKGIVIPTTAYNGQVPGPMMRLRKGRPFTIDVTNTSAREEIVHWHGLRTDTLNDGAEEEGSPLIKPGATLRYHLKPEPSGHAGTTHTPWRWTT